MFLQQRNHFKSPTMMLLLLLFTSKTGILMHLFKTTCMCYNISILCRLYIFLLYWTETTNTTKKSVRVAANNEVTTLHPIICTCLERVFVSTALLYEIRRSHWNCGFFCSFFQSFKSIFKQFFLQYAEIIFCKSEDEYNLL